MHVIVVLVYMDWYKLLHLNEVLISVTVDCVVESMKHAHCCA